VVLFGRSASRTVVEERPSPARPKIVNDAEDIREAFHPYFEEDATLPSDTNQLYTSQGRVMSADLLDSDDEDDQERAEAFRADLNDYVRKYAFLAQIVP
jgi:type I restriction enzyme, R subunit